MEEKEEKKYGGPFGGYASTIKGPKAILFLLFLIVAFVWIVQKERPGNAPYQTDEGMIFGTVFHATYQCDSSLHDEIMAELQAVDASLSMFNPQSIISRINRGEEVETDSLFRAVFTMSQQISKATDGCFDITVAPLVNAWGFGFKHGAKPDSAQVDSLRALVGWNRVNMDENGHVTKELEGMVMDCSAVAKGFGSDQVASLFRRHGIQNFMIEIGGEIVVSGKNPKQKAWNIGVNKPVEDSTSTNREVQTVLPLTDCAMATSGNYRNYYITQDGRKVAHTIDPHTGYPVQHSILSSTVIAPSCAMADGFATSFMVMGLQRAQQVLAQHPELQAYLIYADEKGELQVWNNLKNEE